MFVNWWKQKNLSYQKKSLNKNLLSTKKGESYEDKIN